MKISPLLFFNFRLVDTSHPRSALQVPLREAITSIDLFFLCYSGAFLPLMATLGIFRVLLLPLSMRSLLGDALGRGCPGDVPSRVSCLWRESFW